MRLLLLVGLILVSSLVGMGPRDLKTVDLIETNIDLNRIYQLSQRLKNQFEKSPMNLKAEYPELLLAIQQLLGKDWQTVIDEELEQKEINELVRNPFLRNPGVSDSVQQQNLVTIVNWGLTQPDSFTRELAKDAVGLSEDLDALSPERSRDAYGHRAKSPLKLVRQPERRPSFGEQRRASFFDSEELEQERAKALLWGESAHPEDFLSHLVLEEAAASVSSDEKLATDSGDSRFAQKEFLRKKSEAASSKAGSTEVQELDVASASAEYEEELDFTESLPGSMHGDSIYGSSLGSEKSNHSGIRESALDLFVQLRDQHQTNPLTKPLEAYEKSSASPDCDDDH